MLGAIRNRNIIQIEPRPQKHPKEKIRLVHKYLGVQADFANYIRCYHVSGGLKGKQENIL